MLATYWEFSSIVLVLWAAPGPMLTKSSKLLDVGIESLLAGCVSSLLSATSAVAVYWTAINPLEGPGFDRPPTRNGGSPLLGEGSSRADSLHSDRLARQEIDKAAVSRAIATGCPRKLP